jgi:hypothetical protein
MLIFFNFPRTGFCKMSELLTVPRILIGNRQLSPDATLMSPVEFSPQSASSANVGQSEAASAKDTDMKLVAPTTSAKAATLANRTVDFLVFMQTDQGSSVRVYNSSELDERMARREQLSDAELMRIAMSSRQTGVASAPRSPKLLVLNPR